MKIMKRERVGEILMLGSSLFESLFPILSIITIGLVGSFYSYLIALIIAFTLFLSLMIQKKLFYELKRKEAYHWLLAITITVTMIYALVFIGLKYTTAGNMAAIIFLQLFFSYLFFNIIGKEKIERIHALGAIIMAIGAIVILHPKELDFNKGDFIILMSAMLIPLANYFQKSARKYVSTITILFFRSLGSLPIILLFAFYFEPFPEKQQLFDAMPYLCLIGFLVFFLSKILWVEALHRISVTKVSALTALIPMMTLGFAYIILGEVPSIIKLIGIVIIIIGGYLITLPIKKHARQR